MYVVVNETVTHAVVEEKISLLCRQLLIKTCITYADFDKIICYIVVNNTIFFILQMYHAEERELDLPCCSCTHHSNLHIPLLNAKETFINIKG